MKKHFVIPIILLAALAASQTHRAGELQFLWSNTLDSGVVYDMEFMPDNNYFIMSNSFNTQVRSTENGEIVNIFPIRMESIEFTPDSSKIINTSYYDKKDHIQLRNININDLIKEYTLPDGTDTIGYNFLTTGIYFDKLIVDPIRPFCYALRVRAGYISNNVWVNIQKIIIYNYETMEEVGKLTIPAEETSYYKDIAISKDGKYLAAITENTSFIKVWDLNTRQKIRDYKVCSYIPNVGGGEPAQLTFSQINTDNIYFSGSFPQTKDSIVYYGLFKYNINQNKIVDSTFGVGPKKVGYGSFCLFDNEERIIIPKGIKIIIVNNITKEWEQQILRDTISLGDICPPTRYSNTLKFFIGGGSNILSGIKNNLSTSVPTPQSKGVLYPNPTTGEVTIDINNRTLKGVVDGIHIYDVNGAELTTPSLRDTPPWQGGETININVSSLPNGEYFIVLEGKERLTYKLIINK